MSFFSIKVLSAQISILFYFLKYQFIFPSPAAINCQYSSARENAAFLLPLHLCWAVDALGLGGSLSCSQSVQSGLAQPRRQHVTAPLPVLWLEILSVPSRRPYSLRLQRWRGIWGVEIDVSFRAEHSVATYSHHFDLLRITALNNFERQHRKLI